MKRRAITIPAIAVGFASALALSPLLAALALAVDLIRGRSRLGSLRLVLVLLCFLGTEVAGLILLTGVFVVSIGSPARRAALTWKVQRAYTTLHVSALRAIYRLRFEIEGDTGGAEEGPILVLVRHSSIADVVLPGYFLAGRRRIELRYVLKRELLVVPCLDVAGHWIPNHFVDRSGSDSAREIAAVAGLKHGVGPGEGVLIYPEGTRFSAAKRRQILDRLAADPEAHARASSLRHLLPIRPEGTLALLAEDPPCDVIVFGHAGLEGLRSIADLASGALVGRTLRLSFRRIRAADIPAGREARLAFLHAAWQRLDDWLETVTSTSDRA